MADIKNWLMLILAIFAIFAGFRGLYSGWKSLGPNSPESRSSKSVYRAEIRKEVRGPYLVIMILCALSVGMTLIFVVLAIMDDHGMLTHH